MAVLKIDNEVLSVFCEDCKCCLASTTHCGTCHTRKSIKALCGDGICFERAQDYIAREQARVTRLATNLSAAKALLND